MIETNLMKQIDFIEEKYFHLILRKTPTVREVEHSEKDMNLIQRHEHMNTPQDPHICLR